MINGTATFWRSIKQNTVSRFFFVFFLCVWLDGGKTLNPEKAFFPLCDNTPTTKTLSLLSLKERGRGGREEGETL